MRSRTPLCYRGIPATVKSFNASATKICHFYPSSRHSQPSRSDPTHWTRLLRLQFSDSIPGLVLQLSGTNPKSKTNGIEPSIEKNRMKFFLKATLAFTAWMILWAGSSTAQTAQNSPKKADLDTEKQIELLIAQLGAPTYAQRSEARERLQTFGTRALDAIRKATLSPDPEIASQARYLVQSNYLEWSWSYDPFETRKLIEKYKLANNSDKIKLLRELSDLDNNHGVAALCRISCYETSDVHSKLAAMELLKKLQPNLLPGTNPFQQVSPSFDPKILRMLLDNPESELSAQILEATEYSGSQAAKWLKLAFSNPKPWPADQWLKILDEEQRLLENSSPQTNVKLFVDFTTWLAQQAKNEPDGKPKAIEIARRIPKLLLDGPPDPEKLSQFANWAIESQLPELVIDQYRQLPKQFPQSSPTLLNYLLARSFAMLNQKELADQIAKQTLDRTSFSLDFSKTPTEIVDQSQPGNAQNPLLFRSATFTLERISLAQDLVESGNFAWAEAELRRALEGQEDSPERITIFGLHTLTQLLHDQQRDKEAAETLERWVSRYDNEKLFRMQVEEFDQDLPSNYHLFKGNQYVQENMPEQAREQFLLSIAKSHENVDALIGLARLAGPEETPEQKRRRTTEQEESIRILRNRIEEIERDLRVANPMFQAMEQKRLANLLNTLAWLMTNTDSDPREALLLSRRSCSLDPEQSAFQDTLAHCFEKNGKYLQAFRTQIKAVRLEPHQLSLQRALGRFYEKAAKELP